MTGKTLSRDYRDLIGGALLSVWGSWLAWYSITHYQLGTLQQMGPGMFPAGVGILLTGFGVLVAVPALFRPGVMPDLRVFSPLFIFLGIAAFALMIRPFGLLPAIVAVVAICSMAELRIRPVSLAVLAATLCVLAWLVFSVGLNLPLVMFRWPL